MTKLDEMKEFLNMYQEFWWKLSDYDGETQDEECPLLYGDIALEKMDKKESGLCDFSNENITYDIFFTGDSTHFPGIWIGNNDLEKLDEYPVYIFYMEEETDSMKVIGNFRTYIEKLLDWYSGKYDAGDLKIVEIIRAHLKNFSTNLIDRGPCTILQDGWNV